MRPQAASRSGRSSRNLPRPKGCRCSGPSAPPRFAPVVAETEPMSSLPEAKLDVLLAYHASLEAESLGQLSSERYVQITRELAELNPLIDAVKAYRATVKELADTETLIADSTDGEIRAMAEAER